MAERTTGNPLPTMFAFIAGLSAGAIASMLMAPKSGAEMREQIKGKIQHARSKTKEKVDESKDMVKDRVEDVKDKAKQAADESRSHMARSPRSANAAM